MNFKALILLVVAIALASAQVQKRVIDDFETETPTLIILVDSSALPTAQFAATSAASILGGERDLQITAEQGSDNVVLTAGVSGGIWAVSTPNGASGFSVLQYDGVDGSIVLNPVGLAGVDITSDSAFAFQFIAQTDLDTEYTISLTSMDGGSGSYLLDVPGGNTAIQFIILYTDFDGDIDFTQIGSIEVLVEAHENVDALLFTFTTWGPAGSSASSTPAPPAFSASKSPAPYVSWYTFDDDDDGVSPCGDEQQDRRTYFLQDEDIVYYYFYGFSDPPVQFVTVNGAPLLAAGLISLIALLVL